MIFDIIKPASKSEAFWDLSENFIHLKPIISIPMLSERWGITDDKVLSFIDEITQKGLILLKSKEPLVIKKIIFKVGLRKSSRVMTDNNSVPLEHEESVIALIKYMNLVTGKSYKENLQSSWVQLIVARLNEGFTFEDCKTVIDNKYEDWHNDEKLNKFLRWETLFAPRKFEGYLNQNRIRTREVRENQDATTGTNNTQTDDVKKQSPALQW